MVSVVFLTLCGYLKGFASRCGGFAFPCGFSLQPFVVFLCLFGLGYFVLLRLFHFIIINTVYFCLNVFVYLVN